MLNTIMKFVSDEKRNLIISVFHLCKSVAKIILK
jgi:hypothetical protein